MNSGLVSQISTLKSRLGLNLGGIVYNDCIAIDPKTRKIYVAGSFTTYNGTSRVNLVRLNTNGSLDTTFSIGTGFNGIILSIAIDSDSKLYVGGAFTTFNGETNNRIIKLNTDGTKDTSFDNSTGFGNNRVTKVLIDSNGKIYCGGTFTSYKSVTANRIIRLNTDGSKDTGFDNTTGFDAEVRTMIIDSNGKLYCAGDFTTYKSTTYQRIIRLNTDGSIDTGFDSTSGFNTAGNYILHINIDSNGKIYAAGGFTTYKGVTNNRIIRLNTDGTKDTGFDNSTGFPAETDRVIFDRYGKIYVCGAFTTYKSVTANRIIKLNDDGSKDTSFDNSVGFNSGTVIGMIYDDYNHRILCGGTFTKYLNNLEKYFTRINLDSDSDTLGDATIPSDISGLVAWYGDLVNTGVTRTTLSNGASITRWDDQSGGGYHLNELVGTPTYNSTTKGIVLNTTAAIARSTSFPITGQTSTIFSVMRVNSANGNNTTDTYLFFLGNDLTNYYSVTNRQNANSVNVQNLSTQRIYGNPVQTEQNETSYYTFVNVDNTPANYILRKNNIEYTPSNAGVGTISSHAGKIIVGGYFNSGVATAFNTTKNVDMLELIFYNRVLTTAEIAKIENYLMLKYV